MFSLGLEAFIGEQVQAAFLIGLTIRKIRSPTFAALRGPVVVGGRSDFATGGIKTAAAAWVVRAVVFRVRG